MSGRKKIRVDESEWYRLQRQEQQLKDLRRNMPGLVEEVRRQTHADVEEAFAPLADRQRRTEEVLAGLSDQTRRLETETSRRLQQQAQEMRQALEAAAGRLRAETQAELDARQEALRQEIAAERAERRKEMAHLSEQIGELTQDRHRAETVAQSLLADAGKIAALIAETLPHERFAPGELDRLRARLDTATGNVAQGRYDAAIALTQEAQHALGELRIDVTQSDLAHRIARTGAIQALVTVGHVIKENSVRPVLGGYGEVLEGVTLDVDYWSDGELRDVARDVESALRKARDDGTGTDELDALRSEEAPRLEQWLGDVVERAGMSQLASQIRVNLADAVADTLAQIAAYDLIDGVYDATDPRRAYLAKLRHENGNEILIEVDRAPEDEAQCVLRVLSFDHDVTAESDLRSRAAAIQQALREDGHEASAPVSEPGVPDRAELDLSARSTRRATATDTRREAPAGGDGG